MTIDELARELRRRHRTPPHGEKGTMPILFGIMYADELLKVRRSGSSVAEVVRRAKLKGVSQKSYAREVNSGLILAKYVQPKEVQ